MKGVVFFLAVVFFLSSCGSSENQTDKNDITVKDTIAVKPDNSKEGLKKQIKALEDTLFKSEVLDKKLGSRAIGLYQKFHEFYWQDTIACDYLFKAGEISDNMGYPQKAIELYKDCYEYYPQSALAPLCLFRIGNIYQFTLNDYVEAKANYRDVIRDYPKSDVAKDAKELLKNSEKSDEQLVREFEKKNGIKKEK